MLRHFYPCILFWRSSTDSLKNGVTIYNNQLMHHVKYMCIHSPSHHKGSQENLSHSTINISESPVKMEVQSKEKENFDQSYNRTTKSVPNGGQRTTFSAEEVNKFRLMADSWWNTEGECKALHSLNKLRVALVRDGLIQSGIAKPECVNGPQPLKGLRLLDVGCGGGILCEPLSRLGAEVVGLDAAEENLSVAELHAKKDERVKSNVRYLHGTIENHALNLEGLYDAVIASEVIEHVESINLFVDTCASIIKPGGSFFVTTINKTRRSWLAAIIVAEYILGLLPKGTHDWNKFVSPKQLRIMLERNGCSTRLLHGMAYVPFRNEWFWISDSSVNFALHAVKHSKTMPY